ncbi:MAG: hypothetical protein ACLT9Z_06935 [Finegoldia magna]
MENDKKIFVRQHLQDTHRSKIRANILHEYLVENLMFSLAQPHS